MPSTLVTARRTLARIGDRGRTTRIPDDVRRVILAHVGEARSAGTSWKTIAEQLGLSATVLQRWHRGVPRSRRLQPVVVSDSTPTTTRSLVVITAGGERLEGLGIDDAVRVLRALR